MKRPQRRSAPPSAQQMIREYLGALSSAAQRLLPKGDRLLFVGRTRAALEARVGPLGSAADAEAVAAALTALGDPDDLAIAERERLYSARLRGGDQPATLWKPAKDGRRGSRPARPPGRRRAAAGQPGPPRAWPHRGLQDARPGATAAPEAGPVPSPEARPAPSPGQPIGQPAGPPAAGHPPAAGRTGAGTQAADAVIGPGSLAEAAATGAGPDPRETAPPGGPAGPEQAPAPAPGDEAADPTVPLSIVPGMGRAEPVDDAAAKRPPLIPVPLTEAAALARKHPLEAVCILLIGAGGLFLPFPLWPIGSLLAFRSRRWDTRDKGLALAGPLLFTVACLLILGGTGHGGYFAVLWHEAGRQFGLLLRIGCLLCAGYLGWRLRRGPRRRKRPPWDRMSWQQVR